MVRNEAENNDVKLNQEQRKGVDRWKEIIAAGRTTEGMTFKKLTRRPKTEKLKS